MGPPARVADVSGRCSEYYLSKAELAEPSWGPEIGSNSVKTFAGAGNQDERTHFDIFIILLNRINPRECFVILIHRR